MYAIYLPTKRIINKISVPAVLEIDTHDAKEVADIAWRYFYENPHLRPFLYVKRIGATRFPLH